MAGSREKLLEKGNLSCLTFFMNISNVNKTNTWLVSINHRDGLFLVERELKRLKKIGITKSKGGLSFPLEKMF